MKKRKVYFVPSLLAAGFATGKADAAPVSGIVEKKQSPMLFERLRVKQVYTLAGHSSHASHASHASHTSGSVGGYVPRASYGTPLYSPPDPAPSYSPSTPSVNVYQSAPAVNNTYSPPSAALGTSSDPAPAPPALKMLPGNSDKFRRIVIQVQTALIAFGYYPGPISGQVDAATRQGLSKMQDAYGLKTTGTITPQVLSALGIATN